MRAPYYFVFSSSKSGAIQFAESDFRSFETKRRSATRAPAIGLRAIQHGPFVSDAIIPSLFDTRFIQISIKLSRNAPCIVLLYRCQICSWQKRDATRVTQFPVYVSALNLSIAISSCRNARLVMKYFQMTHVTISFHSNFNFNDAHNKGDIRSLKYKAI